MTRRVAQYLRDKATKQIRREDKMKPEPHDIKKDDEATDWAEECERAGVMPGHLEQTERLRAKIFKALENNAYDTERIDAILRACKEEGLRFIPKEGLGISSVMFTKEQAKYISDDLNSQIEEIEI